MKTNRQKLLSTLSLVKAGLASKEMIEQSTSFVFSNGRVFTYNDEIAISHPLDLDLEGAVSAAELLGLLSKAKDEELDLEVSGEGLLVTGKKFKAQIKLAAEITLPLGEVQIPDAFLPLPDKFAEAVKFCLFSASSDMTKPALTCIHATEFWVESCDNFRLTVRYFDEHRYFPDPILIPLNAARELVSIRPIEYAVKGGWVHFCTEEDTLFSCRTYADLQYPNLDALMDVPEGGEVKFPSDMKEMIGRAGVFSASKIKTDERVRVGIAEGKLTIKGEGDAGKFEESSRVRYSGEPTHFYIAPQFLASVLELTDEAVVGVDRLKFEGNDFIHVVSLLGGE